MSLADNDGADDAALAQVPTAPASVATAVDVASASILPAAQILQAADPSLDDGKLEIAFVDGSLEGWQTLVSDIQPGVQVVVVDGPDPLGQIAADLAGVSGLTAIHIFSHGEAGQLTFGGEPLNAGDIASYQADLAAIGGSLAPAGDLLLYGCNVGEGAAGRSFVDLVAHYTNANVAASSQLVGETATGDNWTLDVAAGTIDVATAITAASGANYAYSLSTTNLLISISSGAANTPELFVSGGSSLGQDVADQTSTPIFTGVNSFTVNGSDVFFDMRNSIYEYDGTHVAQVSGSSYTVNGYGNTSNIGKGLSMIAYDGDIVFSETLKSTATTNEGGPYGYPGTTLAVYDPSTGATTPIAGGGYDPSGYVIANGDVYYIAATSLSATPSIGLYAFNGATATLQSGATSYLNSTTAGTSPNGGGFYLNVSLGVLVAFNGNVYMSAYEGGPLYEFNTSTNTTSVAANFNNGYLGELSNPYTFNGDLYINAVVVNSANGQTEPGSSTYIVNSSNVSSALTYSSADLRINQAVVNGTVMYFTAYSNSTSTYILYSTNGSTVTQLESSFGDGALYVSNGSVYASNSTTLDLDAYNIAGQSKTSLSVGNYFTIDAVVPFTATSLWTLGSIVTPVPTISSAAYDAATGHLTVAGSNFTTSAGDYSAAALTLTGQDGDSYTLTSGSTIAANPTATSFTVNLSAADQLALDGLLNKNGTTSVGATTYNLAAASSFDSGGAADATAAVTVSNALVPTINSVGYNAATGVLTLSGSGFENEGGAGGLRLGDFTLKGQGGSTDTLSAATVAVASQTGATITLTGSQLTSVNALFNENGATSEGGTAYNFAATTGWDSGAGAAITTKAVAVSGVTPTVSSIDLVGSSPNNASSEQFTVAFSEAVTGVAAGDFTVVRGGTIGDSGVSVSGSGSSYTVTVSGVTGDGTMQLDLNSGTGINSLGAAISGGFTGGQVYTIEHTPPVATAINRVGASPTSATSEQFTVTFSEAVTGVASGGFALVDTGTASGAIASVSGSGGSYTVTVDNVTGNGTIKLALNASGTGIVDSAGNALSGGFTSGQSYTIAQAPPTLSNLTTSRSYPVQAPATALSPNLSLTDVEDVDLAGATVTVVGGGFASDGDVLAAVTSGTAITASYGSVTETLTLSGVDTLAHYQAALRSITFQSTANDPTSGGAHLARTIAWQATGADGAANALQNEAVGMIEVASPGVSTSNVTLYPGSLQTVTSGGTASATTVVSGSNQAIGAGGVADGGVVSSGGGQYVGSGGAASGGTISGGAQFVETGGTATGTTVDGGAQADYGATVGTTINSGGTETVEAGGAASGATVNSGGAIVVLGVTHGDAIGSGGAAYVGAGGAASGATVSSGGKQFVEAGGTASGAIVDGGSEVTYGLSISATLNSGGYQYLEAGGTASGTAVNSGAVESVNGVAVGTVVGIGGGDYVNSGGVASGTRVSGGDEYVETAAGAVGAQVDGGAQVVYGTASGATLASGGYQYVEAGGTTSGTTVDSTGVQVVLGTALATTDDSGGADYVYGGGLASGTAVSGGDEYVESGGAARGAHVFGGAQVVYGTATSTTLTGGFQYVSAGGVASATTVDSGGYEYVVSGGAVSGAAISGGEVELTSGGVVGGAAITFATSGGGMLRLDDSIHFGGLIAGFGQPDLLDLADIGFGSATSVAFLESGSQTSGTLTVTDGVHAANLTLLGQYVTAQFTSASDGHGGTLIGDPPLTATNEAGPASLAAHPNA